MIGAYNKGFFVLDMAQNRVDTFRDRTKWTEAVQTTTSLATDDLRDPKSWLVQSRNLAVLAVLTIVLLPWCMWPLVRRIRQP